MVTQSVQIASPSSSQAQAELLPILSDQRKGSLSAERCNECCVRTAKYWSSSRRRVFRGGPELQLVLKLGTRWRKICRGGGGGGGRKHRDIERTTNSGSSQAATRNTGTISRCLSRISLLHETLKKLARASPGKNDFSLTGEIQNILQYIDRSEGIYSLLLQNGRIRTFSRTFFADVMKWRGQLIKAWSLICCRIHAGIVIADEGLLSFVTCFPS
ncbi:hypothetical protein KUCAC02_035248 [Chaenocephalus aceratus]|nr:hypothetical protein KUCAC02_035248 [Chaenocephalus aceratus]